MTKTKRKKLWYHIALWASIPLTIFSAWVLLTTKKNTSFHDVLLLVAWFVSIIEIVYYHAPKVFSEKGRQILLCAALGATTVWAALIRFDIGKAIENNLLLTSLTVALWFAVWRWWPAASKKTTAREWSIAWIIGIVFVVLWGTMIRSASLEAFPLQGDEYFHANTGMGYAETGEYVQWNFLTGEPDWEKPYVRAWPYTWQVAQSVEAFGAHEWSFRLPAFLWGIAFLILLPLTVYWVFRRWSVAFFTTAIAAFDPTMVWLSVFSRMYTMLFVGTLGVAVFTWNAIRPSATMKHWHRTTWFVAALALSAMLIPIHDVAFLLFGGIGAAVTVAALQDRNNLWLRYTAISTVAVLTFALIVQFIRPVIDISFITVRAQPHQLYYWYSVQQFILPVAGIITAAGLLMYGMWHKRLEHLRPALLYAFAFVTPIFIYFVYFANRYTAKKYIAFVLVFAWMLIAAAWSHITHTLPLKLRARTLVGILAFTWILLPLSIPGVEESWALKTDRSDRSFTQLQYHDYPTTYAIIEENAGEGEAAVLMGTKQYYLTRTDIALYETKLQDRLTVAELETIVANHEHGWIMLSREKLHLLPKKFRNYVKDNFDVYHKGKETNLILYRW